jgi:hypothetical protein
MQARPLNAKHLPSIGDRILLGGSRNIRQSFRDSGCTDDGGTSGRMAFASAVAHLHISFLRRRHEYGCSRY